MISAPASPNISMAKNIVTLPPGTMRTQLGSIVDAMAAIKIGSHGFAELRDAVGGRVTVLAVARRLDGCFDDVRRGKEIGLPNSQVDDALALGLERLGAGQDLNADSVPSRDMAWASCNIGGVLSRSKIYWRSGVYDLSGRKRFSQERR